MPLVKVDASSLCLQLPLVKVDAALFLLGLPLVKAVALYLRCRWSICLLAYLPTYMPAYLTTYQPPHKHTCTDIENPWCLKKAGGSRKGRGRLENLRFRDAPFFEVSCLDGV